MLLSRKIEIKFYWKSDWVKELKDYDIIEQLEREAEERIFEMRLQGYVSGELITEIQGIEYNGWFEIEKSELFRK